jgi:hypothetical protein
VGDGAFEPSEKAAQEMVTMAGHWADHGRQYGLDLDYSDDSIGVAEALGLRLYEAIPHDESGELTDQERIVTLELAAYIGESFIRSHGGEWGWAQNGRGRDLGLRTGDGITVYPIATVTHRLAGSDVDSLVIFYRLISNWPIAQA